MNVLVADDDAASRILLKAAIERAGHSCVLTSDGAEAWAVYQNTHVDVVVTDWMMPHMDGVELCRNIRESAAHTLAYPYIIFITAFDELERFQRAMHTGADDFLSKPLNLTELDTRLHVARRITSLYREVNVQRLQLTYQAVHDSLTELPNRTLFMDRLGQTLRSHLRDGTTFAVLLMDLDRFKDVNDMLGHHYGDMVLQETARRLTSVLRESDTVARLGGDEFAVVLPGVDEAGAGVAAGKIMADISRPYLVNGEWLDIGTSIGIAMFPQDGDDESVLMRHVDIAMYKAKRSGDGYALYSSGSDEGGPTRLTLAAELRQAIARGEFRLHYQPRYNLKTHRVDGVEALVRWQHPELGLLGPDQFVPLAEQTGLTGQLTTWVIEAALGQLRAWLDAGLDLNVSVNLSSRDLHDPRWADTIATRLEFWGIHPRYLRLEVTETALMIDAVRAEESVLSFHEIGVRVSIDDFGTGYSSLSYLKQMPFDEIKIDKSFVIDMLDNHDDAVIVEAMIELGHKLGPIVVAEGIENQETLDIVTMLGCDYVQGYYISPPLAGADIPGWLQACTGNGIVPTWAGRDLPQAPIPLPWHSVPVEALPSATERKHA